MVSVSSKCWSFPATKDTLTRWKMKFPIFPVARNLIFHWLYSTNPVEDRAKCHTYPTFASILHRIGGKESMKRQISCIHSGEIGNFIFRTVPGILTRGRHSSNFVCVSSVALQTLKNQQLWLLNTIVSRKYAPPPCIFRANSCWGIFIPRTSPPPPRRRLIPQSKYWDYYYLPKPLGCQPLKCLLQTRTACINDGHTSYFAEAPCFLAPQRWSLLAHQ